MKPTILLDMDEVLVDFIRGACGVFDVTRDELEAARPNNQWEIVSVIEEVKQMRVSLDEFWEEIHEYGEDFWIDLQPMPWAEELLSLIRETTDDWYLVSAPSRCHSSHVGKIKWIKNYFGKEFDKFVLTQHKHLMARPKTLLIDDREANVIKFHEHNGDALIFPSQGNRLSQFAVDPVSHLALCLETYLGE